MAAGTNVDVAVVGAGAAGLMAAIEAGREARRHDLHPAIRKVLRRFAVDATVHLFAEAGVPLKREETGKLFPVTDRSRTVLDALLAACRAAGATASHSWRVEIGRASCRERVNSSV